MSIRRFIRFAVVAAWPALGGSAAACRDAVPATHRPVVAYRAVERARTDSAAELSTARAIDVDGHGNIYVAEDNSVRVFRPDGTLLRTIGRMGMGPGEFEGVGSVEVTPGDSVYVFDYQLGRITVFEPAGARAASIAQVRRDQHMPPYQVKRVQGGRGTIALFQSAYGWFDGRASGRPRKAVVRLLNADGSLAKDSVLAIAEAENLILRNPEAVADNPFGRRTNIAFTRDDRMVVAWSDSLKFDLYSVNGRHLKTVRIAYAPSRRPITTHERDSIIDAMAIPQVPAASIRRAMDEHGATTWPLVREMIVDDRDRVWMELTGAPGEPHHWMAFDLDGARVAQVDLPARTQLRKVRGTTAYAVATDENDVPQVVVMELQPTQPLAMNRR